MFKQKVFIVFYKHYSLDKAPNSVNKLFGKYLETYLFSTLSKAENFVEEIFKNVKDKKYFALGCKVINVSRRVYHIYYKGQKLVKLSIMPIEGSIFNTTNIKVDNPY